MGVHWVRTIIPLPQTESTVIYGPYSLVYFERRNTRQNPIDALQAILGPTEALWITSQGSKVFKVDLSGVMDDEKPVSNYLKVRK